MGHTGKKMAKKNTKETESVLHSHGNTLQGHSPSGAWFSLTQITSRTPHSLAQKSARSSVKILAFLTLALSPSHDPLIFSLSPLTWSTCLPCSLPSLLALIKLQNVSYWSSGFVIESMSEVLFCTELISKWIIILHLASGYRYKTRATNHIYISYLLR